LSDNQAETPVGFATIEATQAQEMALGEAGANLATSIATAVRGRIHGNPT